MDNVGQAPIYFEGYIVMMNLRNLTLFNLLLIPFLGILPNHLIAQASLPEQNKYVLKSYMVIPWGDGKGQLPLETDKDNPAFHAGPDFFQVDDKGNVFVCDGFNSPPMIKKFDPKGHELASIEKIFPDEFTIQKDKVVITSGNKIVFLNRSDLSKVKEIDVPEEKHSLPNTRIAILNGALFKPHEKDQLKLFVFDENARTQNPDDEKNYCYVQGIVSGNEGHEALMVNGKEILNLTEKFKEWTNEKMFGYGSATKDKFGDFYLSDAETHNEYIDFRHAGVVEKTLFKFNQSGRLLCQLKTHREQFLSYGQFAHYQFFIDNNGSIYSAWGNEGGFHIDEYRYFNEGSVK